MSELWFGVLANLIAWPIIVFLGFAALRTWRIIKKIDDAYAVAVKENVSYRPAASARAVADVVMGCSAFVVGFCFMLFNMILGAFDLQNGWQVINHQLQKTILDGLLVLGAGEPSKIPEIALFPPLMSDSLKYISYFMMATGFLLVSIGRRLLTHLARAALR